MQRDGRANAPQVLTVLLAVVFRTVFRTVFFRRDRLADTQ